MYHISSISYHKQNKHKKFYIFQLKAKNLQVASFTKNYNCDNCKRREKKYDKTIGSFDKKISLFCYFLCLFCIECKSILREMDQFLR